jgi:hypothetical protein
MVCLAMTNDQKLGQLRALFTTLAGVLVAWGVNDGHNWMPIVGVLLAVTSLAGGIRAHLDPAKPGKLAWSLIRKALNAGGAAAVTYGALSADQAANLALFLGALGPILASVFSWIDNDDGSHLDFGGPGLPMILLLLAAVMFLPSCGITITEDGCILGKYQRDGHAYYAGPCVGPDLDGDGESDIDRFRVQWTNTSGDRLRATYSTAGGRTVIEYRDENGVWIKWSSKSGVSIGPVPVEVQRALEGEPEPIPTPPPGPISAESPAPAA